MSQEKIQHFLLVFDHRLGRLVDLVEFGRDGSKAFDAYTAKEQELRGDARMEIVLIGSDSIETVRRTHANYFERPATSSKYFDFAGIR